MKVSEITGKNVLDINANKVGKVVDIKIDLEEGRIVALQVRPGLMKKKIDIEPEYVKKVGDTIILNVAKDDIL